MATAREVCPPQVSLVSIAPLGAKKRRPVDGRATAWLVSRNRYTANAATMALTIRMNRSFSSSLMRLTRRGFYMESTNGSTVMPRASRVNTRET
jgi:hypothetical protein